MTDDNGNGRITNAVVKKEVELLTSAVKELTTEVRANNQKLDERIRSVETCQSSLATEVKNLKEDTIGAIHKDIDGLKKKSDGWDLINSLGAIAAFISGVVK